ncbi:MAG: AzlC family ABC transporter permease [Rhizobiales bacterium]|nr:AzlC family ABC transporter permease [Hyphomicrobiales bacterium]
MSASIVTENGASPAPVSEFWRGVRVGLPIVVAASPFALLFGALAVDNGFTVGEVIFMSAAIFGGASQMVGIELFGQHIAPWLVVLSIFAVNFRHVLYSATIGRRLAHWPLWQQAVGYFVLTDPQFAEAEREAEQGRRVGFAWYAGMGAAVYVPWVVESGIGAVFGRLIPDAHALGVDFLLPIYFLGVLMSFRARAFWLPVVAASALVSVVAYKTIGSPWHVSAGALAGVVLGAFLSPVPEEGTRR